ncbi:hypothetical protein BD413DRAFT_475930 [Trametes elegans]|nr:hypothetical protein BD413DRAFT_475930 [Trametes elegans]
MSLLARSAAPLRQVAVRARAVPARSVHSGYKPVPFSYHNKGAFGLKVGSYLIAGFSLPFVAAYYQLYVFSPAAR